VLGLLLTASLASSGRAETFTYANFTGATGLSLAGSASIQGADLRLTPAMGSQEAGAWHTGGVHVAGGFTTSFDFQFTMQGGGGADGITFNAQAESLSTLAGEGSPDEHGPPQAIAVGFDTYQNTNFGDPSANFAKIIANNRVIVATHDLTPDGINLHDNAVHHCTITYDGTAFTVVVDTKTIFTNVHAALGTGADCNGYAWVGFGARTGGSWEQQDILKWSFTSPDGTHPAPAIPSGVTGTPGDKSALLQWNPVSCAGSYNVMRSTTSGGPYTLIASPTGPPFVDSGLTNGTKYYYVVQSSSPSGTSGNSTQVTVTPAAGTSGTGVTGNYYTDPGNGTRFNTFKLARLDPTIDFTGITATWPPAGVGAAGGIDFSVRWVGMIKPLTSETYTFYATGDDGVRLFVNGQLVADGFVDQGPTTYSGQIDLVKGQMYNIELDYFQDGGGAYATLEYSTPTISRQIIPAFVLYPQITTAPPVPTSLTARAGDGEVLLNWNSSLGAMSYNVKRGTSASGPFTTIASVKAAGGYEDLTAVNGTTYYYVVSGVTIVSGVNKESADTSPAVSATPGAGLSGTGIRGDYFTFVNDATHQPPNVFNGYTKTQIDPNINFTYTATNFSVIWSGQIKPDFSETYTFYATGDDGVRLFINDKMVADGYVFQGPTTYSGTIALTAGQKVDFLLAYFQGGGGGTAKVEWSSPSLPRQTLPRFFMYPGGTPNSVSGKVTLNGYTNPSPMVTQPIAFDFRATDGNVLFERVANINSSGNYSFAGVPPARYDVVHIKGAKWLAQNEAVNTTAGDATGINSTQLPGDVNNDNRVGILDLGLLADTYLKSNGQTGYNAGADFNGDNKVDILDLGLLADNYLKVGDP
jgi:hypothetical protein